MGDELRDRLRRMRREAESSPVEPTSRATLPAWFVERAQRRLELDVDTASLADTPAAHATSTAPPRDLRVASNHAGEFAARIELYATDFTHGATALDAVDRIDARAFELLTKDSALADLDPRRAVYLDIETTGLSGGAGTQAFMIGLGRFDGARFELWQGFLREPGEERALLSECAERIRAARGLVSFFGKAFDRHRLEDKMRMHRVEPPFAGLPHLDLFHPCRRLYRGVLGDARLRTMERALCGVEREADLPGSFAPAAWINFQYQRPHLLEKVFEHNRDDVLSLVTLCAHIGRALHEDQPRTGRETDALDTATLRLEWSRSFALATTCAEQRRWNDCAMWAERAALLGPTPVLAREATWLRARALARCDERNAAAALIEQLALDARDAIACRAAFEASRTTSDRTVAARWLALAREIGELNRGSRAMGELLARIERATARLERGAARRKSARTAR